MPKKQQVNAQFIILFHYKIISFFFFQLVGDVLTFLDAHCETTTGWLEPLLYRIKTNPKAAVCPIIDIISDETFALLRSFELHHGGISWNLHFRWFGASETLMKVSH